MQSPMIKKEISDDLKIMTIALDRPPVNAWTKEGYIELSSAIAEANASTTISVVILKAHGRMFSAGADVKTLAADSVEDAARRRPLLRKAAFDLMECQVPVIAAVHGLAIGMGAVVVTSADVIIAAEGAELAIPEINVGVAGAAAAIRRIVPEHLARSMALTGRRFTVERLYEIGSVEKVVPKESLEAEAYELAELISSKGYLAVRKWKESLNLTEPGMGRRGLMIEQCLGQELSLLSNPPSL